MRENTRTKGIKGLFSEKRFIKKEIRVYTRKKKEYKKNINKGGLFGNYAGDHSTMPTTEHYVFIIVASMFFECYFLVKIIV